MGAIGFYLYNNSNKKGTEKVSETKQKETLASSYRMSGNGLEDFDLAFMKLESNEKNLIYSPLSIKYALAMLSEGANGETQKQIEDYQQLLQSKNQNYGEFSKVLEKLMFEK